MWRGSCHPCLQHKQTSFSLKVLRWLADFFSTPNALMLKHTGLSLLEVHLTEMMPMVADERACLMSFFTSLWWGKTRSLTPTRVGAAQYSPMRALFFCRTKPAVSHMNRPTRKKNSRTQQVAAQTKCPLVFSAFIDTHCNWEGFVEKKIL